MVQPAPLYHHPVGGWGAIYGIYDGEFESSYSNICPEELQLGKENSDKHEASFWI